MANSGKDTSFFQAVKERCDLEDYLVKHLKVDLIPAGSGMMRCLCPFHDEDTPSCVVYEEGEQPWKRWHCYGSCADGGSILDAVMRSEDTVTDVFEAAEFLNDLYQLGLEQNSEAYRRFKKTVDETREATDKAREEWVKEDSRASKRARAYMHNRGFSDETVELFGLGVDTERTTHGRLSIPLYDKSGQPISAAYRALWDEAPCRNCGETVKVREMARRLHQFDSARRKEEPSPFLPGNWDDCPRCGAPQAQARIAWLTKQDPKYLFIKDFDKSRYLYNHHRARVPLQKDKEGDAVLGLFLMEGYADVWAGHQSGHPASCAYNGSVLSDDQAARAVEMVKKDGRPSKPVILVPDFDTTGMGKLNAGSGIGANIRKLRAVDPTVEVQVVHGIDGLIYKDERGEDKACKDLGEVLQAFGAGKVSEVLTNNRWPASEWEIRQVIEAKNSKTGGDFYSKEQQLELVSEILTNVRTRESLDHMIPMLAQHWNIREAQVMQFMYARLTSSESTSSKHLMKDIGIAEDAAYRLLTDHNVMPLGFAELDACFPGGGVRRGQLMLMLGKSGTGKAQPLDAKVLTPTGWATMGDMRVGSEVVNPMGGTARVSSVHPQGVLPIHELRTADGRATECCSQHLWLFRVRGVEAVGDTEHVNLWLALGEEVEIPVHNPGADMSWVAVESVIRSRATPAQCIKLDSENELYVTDDNLVTHNTMLASQMLGNMAEAKIHCLFLSLEMGAGSFFPRLACQALALPMAEIEQMIVDHHPDLEKVRELHKHMVIVDNVPTETQPAVAMTPGKIQAIIQEANLTRFEDRPVDMVIVDHLGFLEVSDGAPSDVKRSETAAPGYIMKELFAVCKATNVFMMVLGQLPKEIKSGLAFDAGAGYGSSLQQNFSDYIMGIWRPEQAQDLTDEERISVANKYMVALSKNRHGRSTVSQMYFDQSTLRIMPGTDVTQPQGGGEWLDMGDAAGSETPMSAEALENAAKHADPLPRDLNKVEELFAQFGAVAEGDEHSDIPF